MLLSCYRIVRDFKFLNKMLVQSMLKQMKILYKPLSYKPALQKSAPWLSECAQKGGEGSVWLVWISSICQHLCLALLKVFIIFRTTEVQIK